ncbi:MAG: S8 family serine peptidase [Chloroflexaceae bacterium]|nr:S8 family serine peptidase [Chloroflexaceae bacterium]
MKQLQARSSKRRHWIAVLLLWLVIATMLGCTNIPLLRAAPVAARVQPVAPFHKDDSPPPSADQTATSDWAVRLRSDSHADSVAAALDAQNLGQIGNLPHIYRFRFGRTSPRMDDNIAQQFAAHPAVLWFEQQMARQRHHRQTLPADPNFPDQWHLDNTGQIDGSVAEDLNVLPVWNDGIQGNGVVIGIVDDGLQHEHPDLSPNYRAEWSYDFNDGDPDPAPESSFDAHGTATSGVAAARDNDVCGVGVAPRASLAGLRLLAAPTTDADEAEALTYAYDDIALYSNSWGPYDDGAHVEAPGELTRAAFADGVLNGRGGLGSIYVWAAGNGLRENDNVNYDGYANLRYTIAVGAVDHHGRQAYYSEPGAAMLVTAPSAGDASGITTSDLIGQDGYAEGNCTADFGGTSASTPMVAGVVALMLEANPNLTWRDVQAILVHSAAQNDPTDSDWKLNGAGLPINHKYGFGRVDATVAVNLARNWTSLAEALEVASGEMTVNQSIPDNNPMGTSHEIVINEQLSLEHVEVVLNVVHSYRGDLEIRLISPGGTESVLAEPHGDPNSNYDQWRFMSVRHWDELSAGAWRLELIDRGAEDEGIFVSWELILHGTVVNDSERGTLSGQVTADETGQPLAAATLTLTPEDAAQGRTGTRITDNMGTYTFVGLLPGDYRLSASAYGYQYLTDQPLTITAATTTTLDMALDTVPTTTLQGRVTDGSGGNWPLYARIDIAGYPYGPVFTNPVLGTYQVDLLQSTDPVSLTFSAVSNGYQPHNRELMLTSDVAVADVALTVDPAGCAAPGYRQSGVVLNETFETGALPAGWQVIDYADTGQVWRFDDPGNRTNLTGGEGGFAIVDSDAYPEDGYQDTELRTPPLDFSNQDHVFLSFATDYRNFGDTADVDISIDGGATWTTVWRQRADYPGPATVELDLSDHAAGQAQVLLRFHYYDAYWAWWWMIDDVVVVASSDDRSCERISDGLVVGNVYDATQPERTLDAVIIPSESGAATRTVDTPADDQLDADFYTLGLPAGNQTLVAEALDEDYFPATANVTVLAEQVIRQDIMLERDRAELSFVVRPQTFSLSSSAGKVVTHTVYLENTGQQADSFTLAASGADWDIAFPTTVGPIAPGNVLPIELVVTIPPNAIVDAYDEAEIRITSQMDANLQQRVNLETWVIFDPNATVVVTPQHISQTGVAGNTVNYTLQVNNNTPVSQTLDVSILSSFASDWPINAPERIGPLQPGEQMSFDVAITIPADTPEDFRNETVIELMNPESPDPFESFGYVTLTAVATLETIVEVDRGVMLTTPWSSLSALPGHSVTYTMQLSNTGQVSSTYMS